MINIHTPIRTNILNSFEKGNNVGKFGGVIVGIYPSGRYKYLDKRNIHSNIIHASEITPAKKYITYQQIEGCIPGDEVEGKHLYVRNAGGAKQHDLFEKPITYNAEEVNHEKHLSNQRIIEEVKRQVSTIKKYNTQENKQAIKYDRGAFTSKTLKSQNSVEEAKIKIFKLINSAQNTSLFIEKYKTQLQNILPAGMFNYLPLHK